MSGRLQLVPVILAMVAGLGACIDDASAPSRSPVLASPVSPVSPPSRLAAKRATSSEDGQPQPRLELIGEYRATGAAEIIAYDAGRARVFVTKGGEATTIDVVDIRDPRAPVAVAQLDIAPYGGSATSVDVSGDLVVVAVPGEPVQAPGKVVVFDADGLDARAQLEVGALPDMLSFSPDGRRLVVACEGEPADDYSVDPPGAIAIIDLDRTALDGLGQDDVRLVGFEGLAASLPDDVHIDGEGFGAAADLEPEFVAISADSQTAWVSLQENNALARVDLDAGEISWIVGLGETVQPRLLRSAEFASVPARALRQPDGIAAFRVAGADYLVTANEGDCRLYSSHHELARLADQRLDPTVFPTAQYLQRDDVLGRLAVSSRLGDLDADGDLDELHSCGSRSISIWTGAGELVWDSGAVLDALGSERLAAIALDEGPGPEGVVTAEVDGRVLAFVGLERLGGIALFDLSEPSAGRLVGYEDVAGDPSPEGLEFVPASDSPIGAPLLIVANERSFTVRIYELIP